jgi:hypothetical protein
VQGLRSIELRAGGLAMILDGIDVSKLKRVLASRGKRYFATGSGA